MYGTLFLISPKLQFVIKQRNMRSVQLIYSNILQNGIGNHLKPYCLNYVAVPSFSQFNYSNCVNRRLKSNIISHCFIKSELTRRLCAIKSAYKLIIFCTIYRTLHLYIKQKINSITLSPKSGIKRPQKFVQPVLLKTVFTTFNDILHT